MPICYLPPSLQLSRHFILVYADPGLQPTKPHVKEQEGSK